MRRQKAILSNNRRGQCKFGYFSSDQIQISRFLGILAEYLKKSGVINAVVVVVPTMDVETRLGHSPATHIEHVRQAFAYCCI